MQTYKQHFSTNFHLAYPVMLSQLGHILVSMADSIMVGQLGAVPLAGASLGNVLFHLLLTFGLGISYGSTPLIAAADGEGDRGRIKKILRHSLVINLVTGTGLFCLVLIIGNFLDNFDQPPEVVEQAVPYLFTITFSLVPLMVFQTFRQLLEGLSKTRKPMYISLGANVVNVFLNYVLIFGKFGFEPMGLLGAGYATLISRVVMMIVVIIYYYASKSLGVYKDIKQGYIFEWAMVKRILNIGIPAGLQYIFEVGSFGMAVIMMGWLGTIPQAAHQIAINLAAITYMMASGLAAAATIRVGNQLGKKDIPNLRRAAYSLLMMVVVFMATMGLIFILGRHFLPTLYISNLEVISIASVLLIVAAFFQISDGVQVVSLGALRGLEDTRIPTFISFIAYWIIALPVGYLLGFVADWGAIGIWIGLLVGLTLTAVLLPLRFRKLVNELSHKIDKS